jgi:hypothetical protein
MTSLEKETGKRVTVKDAAGAVSRRFAESLIAYG